VKDPSASFPPGRLVTGTITSVNSESGKIEMSLKSGDGKLAKEKYKYEDLTVGKIVKCNVRRIESFGIFLSIRETSLSGLCHTTEVDDKPVRDFSNVFSPGDYVKAIILKLNPAKQQISLSLKPSKLGMEADSSGDDESAADVDEGEPVVEKMKGKGTAQDGNDADGGEGGDNSGDNSGDDSGDDSVDDSGGDGGEHGNDDSDGSSDDSDVEGGDNLNTAAPALDVEEMDFGSEMGFAKTDAAARSRHKRKASAVSDDSADGTEVECDAITKPTTAGSHKTHDDERLVAREASLADDSSSSMTEADYQREIVTSPNSSIAWIKLMAFQLSVGQVQKAREVVEKGLTSISFREESEKFNIWVAFLNLEKMYGTKESLQQVFERAIVYNDPKKVYTKMVEICLRAEEHETVEDLYIVMTRKFKTSPDVWCQYGWYKLKQEDAAGAKQILERGLKFLDKSKHVSVISKYGEMEFKIGDPERGRTYLESVVKNNARRVDIWSIYIDMEIKNGDDRKIRRLFERATSLQLSTKKMKFLFKRYLEYAKKSKAHASIVAHIKEKARSYVESKSA